MGGHGQKEKRFLINQTSVSNLEKKKREMIVYVGMECVFLQGLR